MPYDNDLIAAKLRRWETFLQHYRLPVWEDIPNLGLYMEQVIQLLKEYLDYLPPELKEEQVITAAAINNYVRKKVMPEPVKKKYYRTHIAYLIMICSLKQSLNIATLQTMIPVDLDEEALKATYTAYARRHTLSVRYFCEQVKLAADGVLGHEKRADIAVDSTEELIVSSAVVSGFARLLAEKLLLLEGHTIDGDENDAEK